MPSPEQAILVATGADHPGVLDDVSLFLHERKAKLFESRVSLLGGHFALLLLIGGDDAVLDVIRADLPELEKKAGIDVFLREARAGTSGDFTPMRLRATGKDPAVTVHRLSHLMRVLGTNIENIETHTTPAGKAEGGFELEMELSVPRHTPVVMLKQYVQSLASELSIECEVESM